MARIKWTDEMLMADAAKYQTPIEWQKKSRNAYSAAQYRGVLQECTVHMNGLTRWTGEMLMADAAKYQTPSEWAKASRSAYDAARRRGVFQDCTVHMNGLTRWTDEMLIADAAKYQTRSEWCYKSGSAYATAIHRNLLDQCSAHMEPALGGTRDDAIYIWKAEGEQYNGKPIYKIGVTSAYLDDQRINHVAKASGFTAKIVTLTAVDTSARSIERQLHDLGEHPGYEGFDGCTEFRALSGDELNTALDIIHWHAVKQAA